MKKLKLKELFNNLEKVESHKLAQITGGYCGSGDDGPSAYNDNGSSQYQDNGSSTSLDNGPSDHSDNSE